MEIFFEILFQFIAEIVIQIFGEVLFDLGFHSLAEALQWKEKRSPFLAAAGYLIWGGIIGALTLLIFPSLIIKSQGLRIINLVLTPIIAGLIMAFIGSLRRKKGHETLRIDTFLYGALFAFSLAFVRFAWNVFLR